MVGIDTESIICQGVVRRGEQGTLYGLRYAGGDGDGDSYDDMRWWEKRDIEINNELYNNYNSL